MEISINNHPHQIQEQASVQVIINDLMGEKQKGIAVAVNDHVIPRGDWDKFFLHPFDHVLVIRATQGG